MSQTDGSTVVERKSSKRKRSTKTDPEIEIDVNLPEPLSKKELRKAKKQKVSKTEKATGNGEEESADAPADNASGEKANVGEQKTPVRSQFGIWIGNLPWTCDRNGLEAFFEANSSGIKSDDITRIHMPAPAPNPNQKFNKPVNKGFAYVDFATEASHKAALALSETPIGGRNVLIKNAKDFNGRPDAAPAAAAEGKPDKHGASKKLATDKLFVGNLGFEITKEELREHFEQCGEVSDVFLATFEDTGKCKGYGWVTFGSVEAAQAAERGYVFKQSEADGSDDDGEASKERKPKKPRKWFVNKLHGRPLRCEFAEHASERYNKRFGKGRRKDGEATTDGNTPSGLMDEVSSAPGNRVRALPRKRDARTIAPGAAHMNAQRSTSGIIEATGKKIVFD